MALLDLSLVTRSLVRLVKLAIESSPAFPGPSLTVTSRPPDVLQGDGGANVVSLYLFHATEQAAYKNKTWPGRPNSPIKYSPLGLDLYYIVTARSDLADELGPYREQLLMGLALKALHDFPIIEDNTMIGTDLILEPNLVGDENKLRLALRHVPVNEAVSYWTAGSQAARFSAYYEVSVVLLEPEEPGTGNGRVFAYGVDVLAGGLPRLTGSRSTIRFTLPTETTPREIVVMPGQGAIGDEITFLGSGLSGAIALRVRGAGWLEMAGAAWGVHGDADHVFATVQADVNGEPMIPGTYAAAISVTTQGVRSDGSTFTTTRFSNEVPFVAMPSVNASAVVNDAFTITGGLFADPRTPAIVDVLVRVAVGGIQLAAMPQPLDPGTFEVTSPTMLTVRLPPGMVPGQPLQIRVEVQGAEAAPAWVVP